MAASNRSELIEVIKRSLGSSMVDVELDADDYHMAIDKSIEQFRKQSENSTEEAFVFLDLKKDTNVYFLGKEVIEVRQIFRRSIGTPGQSGSEVDPFELAYTNVYLLQAGTWTGGIATYDMFTMYQEELGKLFGFYFDFTWNPDSGRLEILRRPLGPETVALWVYLDKPEDSLISGRYTGPWVRDWAIAEAKSMLGMAYRKYSNIAGPSGGVTLPGSEMIAESKEMKEDLLQQLRNYENDERPPTFVIG